MPQTECLSDDVLRLLLVGKLSSEEAEPYEAHLTGCDACAVRTRNLATSDTLVALLPGVKNVRWTEEDEEEAKRLIARVSDRSQLATLSMSMEATQVKGHAANSTRTEAGTSSDISLATPSPAAPADRTTHTLVLNPVEGTQIDAYRLEKKLGEGGMGAVWKAFHTKLKKHVALKLLPAHLLRNADLVSRFEREMEAVGRLDHPAIVRAMDAGEVDGTHYLVMEYVEGVDLGQFVKSRGPRSVKDSCELVRQAAVGLAYAHKSGLVHRDIKPSNLFLTKDGKLKILDLGLARLQGDTLGADAGAGLTGTGQVLGTPDYMAPEQWENTHTVGPACDLYALGCTLFFLLTGRPPFGDAQHNTLPRKMMGHVSEAIPDLAAARKEAGGKTANEAIPAEVDAVYRRLMAKDPAARFASADELARSLLAILKGTTTKRTDDSKVEIDLGPSVAAHVAEPSTVRTPQARAVNAAPRTADKSKPPAPPRGRKMLALGGLAAALVLGGVITVIKFRTPDGKEGELRVPGSSAVTVTTEEDGKPAAAKTSWHGWPADAPKPAIAPFDAEQAKKHQEEWAAYLKVPVEYTNSIGMKFRLIPPGEFLMGASPEEIKECLQTESDDPYWRIHDSIRSAGPAHRVALPSPHYCFVTAGF